VSVYPQHEKCPLCAAPLGGGEGSETRYPAVLPEGKKHIWAKTFLLLGIVGSILCVFINIFEPEHSKYIWSLIVCAGTAAAWVITASLLSETISPGAKLLNIFFAAVGATLAVDFAAGFTQWSTTYVIPFTAIGLTALLTLLAIRDRKRYQEYRGYLLAMFFISLCPIFVFLLSLSLFAWTACAAALYSVFTAIGFWILAEKGFRTEMKKRFHV
jgi:hypothetical protein